MLKEKMYVRIPDDIEDEENPRVFTCGQVIDIDNFTNMVRVSINDPFNYLEIFDKLSRGNICVPFDRVHHCSLFSGSEVLYHNNICTILTYQKNKSDGYYYYYIQDKSSKEIVKACETDIIASFNNGRISPAIQLKDYEFQNPCWYMCRSVVSKSMNILENSIYGFKDLAGSKIYLLPHQVNTIMRCLQEPQCRYMLADEVGMGKTIEAISILKIFLKDKSNTKNLIIVPEALKEQWKSELFFKFGMILGLDNNKNLIEIKTASELVCLQSTTQYDFVIVDEAHRFLHDVKFYNKLHNISVNSKNLLLLSATPVQDRKEEYLNLLRLLDPERYDSYTIEHFSDLIEKQRNIIQKTAMLLDDLDDLEEEIKSSEEEGEDPHKSEDCEELFDDIYSDLKKICVIINDSKLFEMLEHIDFNSTDLGKSKISTMISYICSNYQLESHIIRNRRRILENIDDNESLLPRRALETVFYELDADKNIYEKITYDRLSDWMEENISEENINTVIKSLLTSFFSSPWAFNGEIKRLEANGVKFTTELIDSAEKWLKFEDYIVNNVNEILDDPDEYDSEYSTRIMTVMNKVYEDLFDKKIVLFTSYISTFEQYKKVLSNIFEECEVAFFGATMSQGDLEINALKFQSEKNCRIMLCDSTGGEGRNFQCADFVVHIDIPWDANAIEQRIGRLDRLERDKSRNVVTSVVITTSDTFENSLFDFWNKGLNIFTKSLSGMEIIMNEINSEITKSLKNDFKFGLADRINSIIEKADNMRKEIKKEQNYDAASLLYKPMYLKLKRLVEYYLKNENELFTLSMCTWASLAGFKGKSVSDGILSYNAESFSANSAINSQIIPPQWNTYVETDINKFMSGILSKYNKIKGFSAPKRSITGTFNRKLAIENDYIHFFCPGDEVFDCIVNNALQSCKGQSAAFMHASNINWHGLIFIWTMKPDEALLLDNNISLHALSPYRGYLNVSQVVVPVSLDLNSEYDDETVIREYNKIIKEGSYKKNCIHLGQRSSRNFILNKEIAGRSNVEWFKNLYSKDRWIYEVESAKKESRSKAIDIFRKHTLIRNIKEEMERIISAKAANAKFYGVNEDNAIDIFRREQEIVLKSITNPKFYLESAAFVWMVNE